MLILAGPAHASFEIIGEGEATDITADGTVVVGRSLQTNETWRWTPDTGQQWLGRAARAGSGVGGGTPDISDDGTVISATIRANESEMIQPGFWSPETSWLEFKQRAEDLQGQTSVAWGLSGDGSTLVGSIHDAGSSGTAFTVVDGRVNQLESNGRNCRACDTNYDGTVIVGWSEQPGSGNRQPTVWTASGMTILADNRGYCQAMAVSPDGKIIIGQTHDEVLDLKGAVLWLKSDFGWVQETLGTLPRTKSGDGQALALDLAADGHLIVGFNRFDEGRSTGFVWSPDDGIMDVHDYLREFDIGLPEDFTIAAVTAISDDGTVLAGYGSHGMAGPAGYWSFRVRTGERARAKERRNHLPASLDFFNPFRTRELE